MARSAYPRSHAFADRVKELVAASGANRYSLGAALARGAGLHTQAATRKYEAKLLRLEGNGDEEGGMVLPQHELADLFALAYGRERAPGIAAWLTRGGTRPDVVLPVAREDATRLLEGAPRSRAAQPPVRDPDPAPALAAKLVDMDPWALIERVRGELADGRDPAPLLDFALEMRRRARALGLATVLAFAFACVSFRTAEGSQPIANPLFPGSNPGAAFDAILRWLERELLRARRLSWRLNGAAA